MVKFKQGFKNVAGGLKNAVRILADDSGVLQWLAITAVMVGLFYWGYTRYVKDPSYNTFTQTGDYLSAGISGQ
ncbi:hypothetical protein [Neomoorella thermoacetica]|uniref:hypothetical protein n=1 Tax=Neomoorella thermoacetica TaxID=1525 RepID=UPI0008FB9FB2|nr:hypothetical protein [Moorella thermoacetica]APC08616.1 hypothetical protein MTJW_14570 [Moorella thermoacetica]